MSLEIRRVGPADLTLFGRVAPGVFDEPIDPARLAVYLADPSHRMIVALADGEVVGQIAVILHRHPDKETELYIDEIGVAPDFRRQGIARQMVDDALALGRELGCAEAWVGAEPDNLAAHRLYAAGALPPEAFVMYLFTL